MVIIESKRDQRVFDWLVREVGAEAIARACMELAGARRPYPSNVAKVLGLVPPKQLVVASREDAAAHLAEIARLLGIRSCS